MKFELLRALKKLRSQNPYKIQWQYFLNYTREKSFHFHSPLSGRKITALWRENHDLREMILAFVNNKWDNLDFGSPGVIVDLGANNGYSALYFKDRFPEAEMFLVDLLQSNTLFSSKLFTLNGISAKHINTAVSNKDCLLGIDLHPSHSRSRLSSLLDDTQRNKFEFSEPNISVPSKTLRSLSDNLGIENIDLLKIDIEGAEQYLLEDINTWSPLVKRIVLEIHHNIDPIWCEKQIKQAGYTLVSKQHDWYAVR